MASLIRSSMPTIVQEWMDYYHEVVYEKEDQRVRNWFLMGSPIKIIGIMLTYIYVVKVAGPNYMKHREPYNLKKIIAVYNVFQIFVNVYFFQTVLTSGWTDEFTLGCQLVDYSYTPKAYRMATTFWYFLLLKIIDYIETIFFVLRKKNNQVSFLHIYHHIVTATFAWIACKWIAGGMASFTILANSLVHVIMYTYYLLALFGPSMQRKMNVFKKTITIIQMVQFWIIVLHALQALVPSCKAPTAPVYLYIPNIIIIFYLFYDFYRKAYKKKVHSN